MIIKEKRWLSRLVAMLCVLTMVVGVLTPASIGVAKASNVSEIKFELDDNISYYDSPDAVFSMEETIDNDVSSDYIDSETGNYQIKKDGNYIYVKNRDGNNFLTNVVFYAETEEDNLALKSSVEGITIVPTYKNSRWLLKIKINDSVSGSPVISVKKQYTVNFTNNSPSDCNIYDGDSLLSGSKKYDVNNNNNAEVDFEVVLNDNVKNSKVPIVKFGKETVGAESGTDGTYKYKKTIPGNMDVIVTTIDKICLIEPAESSHDGYNKLSNATVNYGEPYRFYVTPEAGRTIKAVYAVDSASSPEFNVTDPKGVSPLPEIGTNYYEIASVTTDMEIYVDVSDPAKYNVSFDKGTGYTINNIKVGEVNRPGTTIEVEHGEKVSFDVIATQGYEIARVKAGDKILTAAKDTYTLNSVESDTVISVVVNKKSYTIKYIEPNNKKYDLVNDETTNVEYGTTYDFYITPKDGYNAPTVTAKLTESDTNVPVVINGNKYTINKITGNTTITIAEASKETRKITFNDKKGYYSFEDIQVDEEPKNLNDLSSIDYGSTVKFKVNLDPSCNQSEGKYNVKANGAKLTIKDDYYIIDKITENQVIEVEDVEKNKYTVTLQNGDGYTLTTTDSKQVSYGDTFSFSWDVSAGYTNPNGINIDGSVHTDLDSHTGEGYGVTGNCSFTVTGNTKVSLSGVKEKTYKVTIKDAKKDNADIKIVGQESYVEGGELTGIPYAGECSFTVDAAPYYQIEYVLYNGRALEPASNRVYTISNIRSDGNNIEIKTRENILTVNYSGARYGKAINNEEDTEGSIEITRSKEEDIVLKDLSNSRPVKNCIYKFAGWTWEGNTKPTASGIKGTDLNLQSLIKDTDAEINVKAVWEVDDEAVKEGIQVRTGYKSQNVDNNVKLTFECILNLLEESIGNEHKSDVKITGYGIIYAATPITSIEDQIENVKERKMNTQEGSVYKDSFGNVFNYFINTTLTLDQVQSGNSFRINSVVNKDAKRYGLAWMELTIGDKKIIIHGSSAPEQS